MGVSSAFPIFTRTLQGLVFLVLLIPTAWIFPEARGNALPKERAYSVQVEFQTPEQKEVPEKSLPVAEKKEAPAGPFRKEQKVLSNADIREMILRDHFYSTCGNYNFDFCNPDGDFKNLFKDNGDGTVTDNLTGLMWTKDANVADAMGGFQWALDYVAGMNSGSNENFGYTDWRVPNIRELMSLIDYGMFKPVLSTGHPFTDVQGNFNNLYYHTSTSHAANHTHTYCVSFYHADVTACNKYPEINDAYLWPVRGGN